MSVILGEEKEQGRKSMSVQNAFMTFHPSIKLLIQMSTTNSFRGKYFLKLSKRSQSSILTLILISIFKARKVFVAGLSKEVCWGPNEAGHVHFMIKTRISIGCISQIQLKNYLHKKSLNLDKSASGLSL